MPWVDIPMGQPGRGAGVPKAGPLPAVQGCFQKVYSALWTSRSPDILSFRALGGNNYNLITCKSRTEEGQATVSHFVTPAVLNPGAFPGESSKWMLARSIVSICIELAKVLKLKKHIVDGCDLYLSQKESLRLSSLIVWLSSLLWTEMKLRAFR